jgi:hypothetical protein
MYYPYGGASLFGRQSSHFLYLILFCNFLCHFPYYQTLNRAPLAKSSSNDDEEWGWEDSSQGGDDIQIELASTKKDDDQDLTMAFSITGKRTSIQPQPATSDPVFHRTSHITSTTSAITTSSQISNPTVVTVVPASTYPHTTPITSLETTPVVATKKKTTANSTQSDDVFTSMGLASTPSFTSSTTSKSAVMPKASTNASKKSSSLSAIDLGLDSNWEDDGDLDDLLDD